MSRLNRLLMPHEFRLSILCEPIVVLWANRPFLPMDSGEALIPRAARCLEIGCGNGSLAIRFFEGFHPEEDIATDFDPRQVEAARRNFERRYSAKSPPQLLLLRTCCASRTATPRSTWFSLSSRFITPALPITILAGSLKRWGRFIAFSVGVGCWCTRDHPSGRNPGLAHRPRIHD